MANIIERPNPWGGTSTLITVDGVSSEVLAAGDIAVETYHDGLAPMLLLLLALEGASTPRSAQEVAERLEALPERSPVSDGDRASAYLDRLLDSSSAERCIHNAKLALADVLAR
jgi:hypothetical protein